MTVTLQLAQPIVTDVLARAIAKADDDAGPRAKATPSAFRYSQAAKCAMQLALDLLEVPYSEPPDLGGRWVMWLGKVIHEALQEAILDRYPHALFEVKSSVGTLHAQVGTLVSGHADAFIPEATLAAVIEGWSGGDTCYELKTGGGFSFDQAIGVDRRRRAWKVAEGPRFGAIVQGALNARALGAQTLIIGMLSLESLSKQMAESLDLTGTLYRFCAEWLIPADVWEPLADAELARMQAIADTVAEGRLPERIVPLSADSRITLDPNANKPWFGCVYCGHWTTCRGIDDPAKPPAALMDGPHG